MAERDASGAERRVLVTGANGGIGQAAVLRLAASGCTVYASCRTEEKAAAVRAAASERGLAVHTVLFDVTDPAAEEAVAALDLYALVNNAGYSNFGAVEDIDPAEAERQIGTMLHAPMRLARAALPAMLERGSGRIVNVSSIFGFLRIPFNGWYQAAKHGLEAASDALRTEVAGRGVHVASVQPGAVDTGLWEDHRGILAKFADSRHARAYQRSLTFMDRYRPVMASSEQVAAAIDHAVNGGRPRSRYLVGLDAHVLNAFVSVVPQGVQDRITRTVLGL